jgi:hypothetical protein
MMTGDKIEDEEGQMSEETTVVTEVVTEEMEGDLEGIVGGDETNETETNRP